MKLKGTQPVKTPAVWVKHLEEESANKDEGTETEDPDDIKGVTKEFIVHLAKGSEGFSAGGENAATTVAAWSTLSMNAQW